MLLEARRRLGGRAYSFIDPATGLTFDNCQHVILGCCDAAVGFLAKIGSLGRYRFANSIRMLASGNREMTISTSKLPSPVHLLPSMASSGYLSLRDKASLVRVLGAMSRREPPDGCSVSGYLQALCCPKAVADLVFRPIAVAVLNEEPELASAKYARMAVLKGMLGHRQGFSFGTPAAPLSDVIAGPTEHYLRDRGGEVRLSSWVSRVNEAGDRVESLTLRNGESVRADAFVAAIPPYSLDDIGLRTDARAMLWRPIISAHLVLEGDCQEFDSVCLADEPFGWVFRKNELSDGSRVCVQAVASAAGAIARMDRGDLTKLALQAVRRAAPDATRCRLVRSVICRQTAATFSTAAGSDELRPSCSTSYRNLFLAGDWTATGWPSTLESAVLSGQAAARAVVRALAGRNA